MEIINRNCVDLFILNNKNEVLLEKKTYNHPILKGMWVPVGGKIDNNETPLQAINRECKEEINININPKKFLTTTYKIKNNNITLQGNIIFFYGRFNNIKKLNILEGNGLGFFNIKEIKNIKIQKLHLNAIKYLLKNIIKRKKLTTKKINFKKC